MLLKTEGEMNSRKFSSIGSGYGNTMEIANLMAENGLIQLVSNDRYRGGIVWKLTD